MTASEAIRALGAAWERGDPGVLITMLPLRSWCRVRCSDRVPMELGDLALRQALPSHRDGATVACAAETALTGR